MEIRVLCHRCETELRKIVYTEKQNHVDLYVEPHICSEYVGDDRTRIEQVKNLNEALQERNTELVEENRKLKAGVVPNAA